jgi:hypothetical protein
MRTPRVEKRLEFNGEAKYAPNIRGPLSEEMVHFVDDFLVDTLNGDNYATSVGNGGAVAIVVGQNGIVRLTANTGADDNVAELEGEANWYAQAGGLQADFRLKIDNILTTGIAFGFADAYANTNDQIAMEISTTTIVDRGTDFVGFCYDTDATNKYWHAVNTKNTTQAGTSLAVAPVNATYERFRISIDELGNATFFRNGAVAHYKASAVTNTAALRLYAGLITRGSSAVRNLDIDKIEAWNNRMETPAILN